VDDLECIGLRFKMTWTNSFLVYFNWRRCHGHHGDSLIFIKCATSPL